MKQYKDEAGITIQEDSDGNKIAMAHPVAYAMSHKNNVPSGPKITKRNNPNYSYYWLTTYNNMGTIIQDRIEIRDVKKQDNEKQWIEQTQDWHKRKGGATSVSISRVIIVKSWEDKK